MTNVGAPLTGTLPSSIKGSRVKPGLTGATLCSYLSPSSRSLACLTGRHGCALVLLACVTRGADLPASSCILSWPQFCSTS